MSGEHTEAPAPGVSWTDSVDMRLGTLILSALCGIVVPLSPLGVEYAVTGEIPAASWFAVAVTYVAGIGMISRSLTILVCALVAASYLAFTYGIDLKGALDASRAASAVPAPYMDAGAAKVAISTASALYLAERMWRHLVDGKPFLES